MKRLVLLFLFFVQLGFSQVGINTTLPNAQLDIRSGNQVAPSNTDGLLIPKIDAFPATNPTALQQGMLVYLTTLSAGKLPGFYYWNNPSTSWIGIDGDRGWKLTGNAGTNAATNFMGTTDNVDVVFKRNNIRSGLLRFNATSFGFNALNPLNTGNYNSAFGTDSMMSNTTGYDNTAVGSFSMYNNTVGLDNTALGYGTLFNNIGGNSNTAAGTGSLWNNSFASKNVAVGYSALYSQSFANGGVAFDTNNVAIGYEALFNNNPTGAANARNNTAIGNYTLRTNTTGTNNTANGFNALYANSTGSNNVANGSHALYSNTTGNNNAAHGTGALYYNTTGGNNTATGTNALLANTSGNSNVAMGYQAMNANTTGYENTSVGRTSMYSNTTGLFNTTIGAYSMYSNISGSGNSAVGSESLYANTTGIYNSAFGLFSLHNNTTGSHNIAHGAYALQSNTTGTYNTGNGYQSLNNNTTGNNNTGFGYETLYGNTTGSANVAIGYQAGFSETGSNKLYIENSSSATPLIYGEFNNDLARINGNFRVKSTTVAGADLQVKNSNLFIHNDDANLNFGTGFGYFMLSTQDNSGGNETGGIRGDGDNVSIWSPGDGGRQLRILDEDAWTDNNGNPYDNGAEVAYIAANGQYFQVSDKNKKENIIKIEKASEKISQISGYTYQYKLNQQEIQKGQKPVAASGVLAQEIEQVLPEAIQKNESGEYFVDYAAITPLLIEAIKDQNAKIKSLETVNAEILKRLELLEKK